MNTLAPSPYEAADPKVASLYFLLLPEMEFVDHSLELVIESLRHIAGRGLEGSRPSQPGGVSITLIANAGQRAQPVTLRVELGDTLLDALDKLNVLTGFVTIAGSLGLLLCSAELGEHVERVILSGSPPTDSTSQYYPFGREGWLSLISLYPILAVSSSPVAREWVAAVRASDWRIKTAFTLAAQIIGNDQTGHGCVVQVPDVTPTFTPIPGID